MPGGHLTGTVDDGRFVVVLAVFTVVGNGGACYHRAGFDPGDIVEVEFCRDC